MKIILRQDVEKVGDAGTLQTVKAGFARNYLIPKGLAIAATEGELKLFEHNQGVKAKKVERQELQLQSLADKIAKVHLTFEARAGEGGRLFGSVTSAEIAERLSTEVGEEIDRRKVTLSDPIRATGDYQVAVHLVGKLQPRLRVTVNGIVDEAETTADDEAPDTADSVAAPAEPESDEV